MRIGGQQRHVVYPCHPNRQIRKLIAEFVSDRDRLLLLYQIPDPPLHISSYVRLCGYYMKYVHHIATKKTTVILYNLSVPLIDQRDQY